MAPSQSAGVTPRCHCNRFSSFDDVRIRPILEFAMARFEHEQGLRQESAHAKTELQDRRVIDRAKSLLIQRQSLSKEVAFAGLSKAAMDKGLRTGEVARRMLDAADYLGRLQGRKSRRQLTCPAPIVLHAASWEQDKTLM